MALELIHIIVDFITLGALGLFAAITLAIWYAFVEAFVFEQGYLSFINRHHFIKAVLLVTSGIVIWGGALYKIHILLWG